MFIPKTDINTAEPIDVKIDELDNNIIQIYQLIGIINDEQVLGLASILNHTNEHFLAKMNQPPTNTIITILKNNNEEAHNIYNIDETKHVIFNMQNVKNNIANNIINENIIQ